MANSRLVLGTVQLGMDYGVNNTHGAPARKEAFAILDQAFAGGIDLFDTAPAYGSAENILGEWVVSRGLQQKVRVVTKMSSGSSIEASLGRLHLSRLDGYLLHTARDLYDEGAVASLRAAKEAGLTAHVGVSVYNADDALRAIEVGMDYVQVPYNALDQRLDHTDFFTRAKEAGVIVFARSPFLQGLLLMKPDALPPHLSHARPYLERFVDIAQRHHLSQLEATLVFSLEHCRADKIVFGAETRMQLVQILDTANRAKTLSGKWISEMEEAFREIGNNIVDPSVWKKA